ncbi:hypothetical protein ABZ769_35455 [Streptomyces olivoreticuli]
MTQAPIPYAPQPGDSAAILPLGTDPHTGTPIRHDLGQHPHLLITAGTGRGATATLRMIAAHTAKHDAEVTLIVRKHAGYEDLMGMDNIQIHRSIDSAADAIQDFAESMRLIGEDSEDRGAELPYRALLLIEHLDVLTVQARQNEHLRRALARLPEILFLGCGLQHHLVAGTGRYSLSQLHGGDARDICSVLALGPRTRTERTLLQLDTAPQPRNTPGAGLLRLPGQQATEIQVNYLAPDQARALVNA